MISKAKIQHWNRKFQAFTAAQKRVAIAKDVLDQIEAKTITPKKGTYVALKGVRGKGFYELPVQENFDKVKCTTCALGGLLTCMVKFTNDATMKDLDNPGMDYDSGTENNLWKRLAKFFGKKQLFLIEHVFENWTYGMWDTYAKGQMAELGFKASDKDRQLVNKVNATWGLYPKTAKDRMIAIMENIIRNNGTFKPLQG